MRDLTEYDWETLRALLRRTIEESRWPLSAETLMLKELLAKLEDDPAPRDGTKASPKGRKRR